MLSETDIALLDYHLTLVKNGYADGYKRRARIHGVSVVIKEILHDLQKENEYYTIFKLAELLLQQFEYLNQPHAGDTDCSISRLDCLRSDTWHSLWDSLIQFTKVHRNYRQLEDNQESPRKPDAD